MFSYYKTSALLPFCIALVTGIILSLTHDGSGYQSEWSTDDGFGLGVFLTILVSAVIALLSFSIYLNKVPVIKKNKWLGLMCWLVPPGMICALFIYNEWMNFTGHNDFDGKYEGNRVLDVYVLAVAFIHVVCLIVGWIRYKKQAVL